MAGFTTAMPTSFKGELPQALHSFVNATGHVFKLALGIAAPAGTYDATTTSYALGADEVPNGSGYTTGGFAWTAAQNITPLTLGTTAYWQWSANPSWTGATFTTSGCVIYNSFAANRAVYVGSFGGAQSVTNGTFTLVQPVNGPTTSLLRIQ